MLGMSTHRSIPSAPGYMATAEGEIIGKRGFALRPSLSPNGYLHFRMSRPGFTPVTMPVHVAVCEAFHGPRPAGMEVAHGNGDKTDNRPDNLSWKTRAQNHADKVRHGTDNRGQKHYACTLTDDMVREIRASTLPAPALAGRYGTSAAYIRHIKAGRARKHVTPNA